MGTADMSPMTGVVATVIDIRNVKLRQSCVATVTMEPNGKL